MLWGNEKMKYAFVVLHYLVTKDTEECIDSIRKNVDAKSDQVSIIVVDNGSPNGSFELLKNKYEQVDNVVILHSDVNLGFARGNNIGFMYAKKRLKSDFIILLNNDTIVKQRDFTSQIALLYNKYHFAALGPDIVSKDGYHQNPFISTKYTLKTLRLTRLKQRIKWLITFFGFWNILTNDKKVNNTFIDHDVINADLHGACLIFSKKYIDAYDGLCDLTFLYMEEEILQLYLKKKNLLSVYSPTISIYHKEDSATNAANKSTRSKMLSKYSYWIQSSYAYEKILKEV